MIPHTLRFRVRRALIVCLLLLAALAGCARSDDKATIESALRQWPTDFNERNLDAVCGLFADDVVLIYPDSSNRDHGEFCGQMRKLFADPTKRYTYAEPEINEVLVDGDLAAVRLVWTLTVTDRSGKVLGTTREDGVDVFTRQADGSWKIHVSHAFPMPG